MLAKDVPLAGRPRLIEPSPPCHPPFLLGGGRSNLRGWTRRLESIPAQGIGVGNAHVAAFVGARSAMPFPRLRSVPLGRIPRVNIRIDVGLCTRRRHSCDDCQSAQATDQSKLHQLTSLFDTELPQFLLGSINQREIKQATHARVGFFERCQRKIRIKLNGQSAVQACGLKRVRRVVDEPWSYVSHGLPPGPRSRRRAAAAPTRGSPARALGVDLPRVGLQKCISRRSAPADVPGFLIRPGVPVFPNGAYPRRTTSNLFATCVAEPPQWFAFEILPYPYSGRSPVSGCFEHEFERVVTCGAWRRGQAGKGWLAHIPTPNPSD